MIQINGSMKNTCKYEYTFKMRKDAPKLVRWHNKDCCEGERERAAPYRTPPIGARNAATNAVLRVDVVFIIALPILVLVLLLLLLVVVELRYIKERIRFQFAMIVRQLVCKRRRTTHSFTLTYLQLSETVASDKGVDTLNRACGVAIVHMALQHAEAVADAITFNAQHRPSAALHRGTCKQGVDRSGGLRV